MDPTKKRLKHVLTDFPIEGVLPSISIIIPTCNSVHRLATTLDSVLRQDYADFEVIIVDASSTDGTLDFVANYHQDRLRVYTVSDYAFFEMLNRGIAIAKGEYVTFLKPGDFYLAIHALMNIAHIAVHGNLPQLVYYIY